jgi:hypothetical protein
MILTAATEPAAGIVLTLIGGYVFGNLLWYAWKIRNRESLFLLRVAAGSAADCLLRPSSYQILLPAMPAIILLCFRLSSGCQPGLPAPLVSLWLSEGWRIPA